MRRAQLLSDPRAWLSHFQKQLKQLKCPCLQIIPAVLPGCIVHTLSIHFRVLPDRGCLTSTNNSTNLNAHIHNSLRQCHRGHIWDWSMGPWSRACEHGCHRESMGERGSTTSRSCSHT
ncbi:hypothetical protein DUNSADRAFT_11469 [Dunaliella salina]|uniref:Encoded protein n=1 Tax=Dunaliella salina TaxID=3046 RepID=A0ABQ7GDA7_DUNSA|nr:hypothetical protein DUNSADRAFT_11469 [Dunaliella salina]|eukprot:KAF5832597.1 hypothetical protein DUNSADRAFT_11469 [Dunaliella salina]